MISATGRFCNKLKFYGVQRLHIIPETILLKLSFKKSKENNVIITRKSEHNNFSIYAIKCNAFYSKEKKASTKSNPSIRKTKAQKDLFEKI